MRLIVTVLFLSLVLTGCQVNDFFSRFKSVNKQDVTIPVAEPEPQVNNNLSNEYQDKLKDILQPFWRAQDFSNIKEQVLALTVPKEYLNLHFDLVVALELLEEGKVEADQDKIEQGLSKMNDLKSTNSWLVKE